MICSDYLASGDDTGHGTNYIALATRPLTISALVDGLETMMDKMAMITEFGNPLFSGEGCRLQRAVVTLHIRCFGEATT